MASRAPATALGGPGEFGVLGVPHDPQEPVLRYGASSKRLAADAAKPIVNTFVLHMRRIDQCDEDIDVQQIASHGCSSRS
jgi:hypothetical protein